MPLATYLITAAVTPTKIIALVVLLVIVVAIGVYLFSKKNKTA
ncbi:MAG: hypothetical protein ACREN8_01530 [Candidatus Dormibacteraceae bacterium]